MLSSHSLAQNDCGHISNIPADHVRLGKGWMLSVDAVAVADGENPLSACPDQGSPPFSLTKPVRLPSSLAHCRDVGSCRLPPPSSRLCYVPQVQLPLQPACTTAPAAHIAVVSKGQTQRHRLSERERWGPLIRTCRQRVFAVGDGHRIYTKHPPLPQADVIRRDVRDVATVVLCERV